ncbi:MAG: TIGR02452 family protein [Treponemataceae bacterium]|nr:TIGR02452 family protein [Treponemataceae bacterium]
MPQTQKDRKRIQAFRNTIDQCESNNALRKSIRKSINAQEVFLEHDEIEFDRDDEYPECAEIKVSDRRTLEAASEYVAAEMKTCIVNFTSATRPGGAILAGGHAQEETICRCSTLYSCIAEEDTKRAFYDRHKRRLENRKMTFYNNDDCIFTPNVVVFKNDFPPYQTLSEEDWFKVDVISCAAPRLPKPDAAGHQEGLDPEKLKKILRRRAGRILEVAASHDADAVILGAFGCDTGCPDAIVAEALKEALEEYQNLFRVVDFAVPMSPNNTERYDVFCHTFFADADFEEGEEFAEDSSDEFETDDFENQFSDEDAGDFESEESDAEDDEESEEFEDDFSEDESEFDEDEEPDEDESAEEESEDDFDGSEDSFQSEDEPEEEIEEDDDTSDFFEQQEEPVPEKKSVVYTKHTRNIEPEPEPVIVSAVPSSVVESSVPGTVSSDAIIQVLSRLVDFSVFSSNNMVSRNLLMQAMLSIGTNQGGSALSGNFAGGTVNTLSDSIAACRRLASRAENHKNRHNAFSIAEIMEMKDYGKK